jgi:hypothetical protein
VSQTSTVARTILVASLKARAADMRANERRARGAYRQPGPLRDATVRLADIYARAAELFEAELGQIEFVDGTPPDPNPRERFVVASDPGVEPASVVVLSLDAMNRGRAAVGMPPLSTDDPRLRPSELDTCTVQQWADDVELLNEAVERAETAATAARAESLTRGKEIDRLQTLRLDLEAQLSAERNARALQAIELEALLQARQTHDSGPD